MGLRWKHQPNLTAFQGFPVEPEAAYWAGFWLADGSVREECATAGAVLAVDLQERDRGHLERWARYACPTARVVSSPSKSMARFSIYGADFVAVMRRFGVVPRKSYGHPVPLLHESEVPHFIRGFFDGNGCVGVYRQKGQGGSYPHLVFSGAGNWLARIKEILSVVTGDAGSLRPSGIIFQLGYVGSAVPRILRFIAGDPSLPRKQSIANRILERVA